MNDLQFSPQIQPEHLADLAEQGIQQIICHRPDGEEIGQPSFADIAEAAADCGIDCHHLPVRGGEFPEDMIAATKKLLENGKNTFMYCRSGTRSCTIWEAIAAENGDNIDDIINQAAELGYGIGQLRDYLAARQRTA